MQNSYIQLSSLFRYLQQKAVQYVTAANANWPECLEELNMQMTWGIFPFQSRILWFAFNIVPEMLSLCQEIAETNTLTIQMVRKHINLSVLSETGVWSGSSVQDSHKSPKIQLHTVHRSAPAELIFKTQV